MLFLKKKHCRMRKLIFIGLVSFLYQGCDFCMNGDEEGCGRLSEEEDAHIPVRVTDPEELRRNLRYMEQRMKNAFEEDKRQKAIFALDSPTTTDEDRTPFDSPLIKKEDGSTSPRQNRSHSSPVSHDFGLVSRSFQLTDYNTRMSGRYSPKAMSYMDFAYREREEVVSHLPVAHDSLAEEEVETSDDGNSDISEQLFFGDFESPDDESAS